MVKKLIERKIMKMNGKMENYNLENEIIPVNNWRISFILI